MSSNGQAPPPPPPPMSSHTSIIPGDDETLHQMAVKAALQSGAPPPPPPTEEVAQARRKTHFQTEHSGRVEVKGNDVVLPHSVEIFERPAHNRFVNDFVPPPNGADDLVDRTLRGFMTDSQSLIRAVTRYKVISPPDSGAMLEYEVDEVYNAERAKKKNKEKNKETGSHSQKATLNDVFNKDLGKDGENNGEEIEEGEGQREEVDPDTKAAHHDLIDADSIHFDENQLPDTSDQGEGKTVQTPAQGNGTLTLFRPDFDGKNTNQEKDVCKRVPLALWERDMGTQILITLKELKFGIPSIEPFFCSLCVMDLKQGVRLSENFHFDMNDVKLLPGSLQAIAEAAEAVTTSKHALFSVTDKHEDVYLCLQVQRILQGDQAENLDLYMKLKDRTDSELKELRSKSEPTFIKLSDYRQCFAWAMCPLFQADGDFINEEKDVVMGPLYFQDSSMTDSAWITLMRALVANPNKKMKAFPEAHLTFHIDNLEDGDLPQNRVDPSFIALKDDPENVMNLDGRPLVKEVAEFQDYKLVPPMPNSYFVNLMYVYPEFITFQKFRNIACKVQIRDDDLNPVGVSEGLGVLPGLSSGPAWTNSRMTQVNYHLKTPTPGDEVKMMLPLQLTAKTHIFFTFYKVSIKKKSGQREIIGHSVLPLYENQRLLADGVYELPIASKLPTHYLIPFAEGKNGSVRFRSQGEKCFTVRTRLQSTIFHQDRKLYDFFPQFPNEKALNGAGAELGEEILKPAIETLKQVDPSVFIRFLPGLLDHWLHAMVSRPNKLARLYSFIAINTFIHRVSHYYNQPTRSELLVQYITHRFTDEEEKGKSPLFLHLFQQWNIGLERRKARKAKNDPKHFDDTFQEQHMNNAEHGNDPKNFHDTLQEQLMIRNSWFYFELGFKSLVLRRERMGSIPTAEAQKFVDHFSDVLANITYLTVRHRGTGLAYIKSLLQALALFFVDLFAVLDRSVVMELIMSFLNELTLELQNGHGDPILIDLKFNFYAVIFDSQYFMDIHSYPEAKFRQGENSVGGDDTDLITTLQDIYCLPFALVNDVCRHLQYKEAENRGKLIDTLRNCLTKIEFNKKLQDRIVDAAILFLPLVQAMIDELPTLKRWAAQEDGASSSEEKKGKDKNDGDGEPAVKMQQLRNMLICLAFVLKHTPDKLLILMWSEMDEKEISDFFLLLELMVTSFAYKGIRDLETNPTDDNRILAKESITGTNSLDFRSEIESLYGNNRLAVSGRAHRSATLGSKPVGTGTLSRSFANLGVIGSGGKNALAALENARSNRAAGGTLRQLRKAQMKQATLNRNNVNTMTTSSRDSLLQVCKWEGAMANCIGKIALTNIVNFLKLDFDLQTNQLDSNNMNTDDEDFSSFLDKTLHSLLSLFCSFLANEQSTKLLVASLQTLRWFISRHGCRLYSHQLVSKTAAIADECLRHCTFLNAQVRKQCTLILLDLIKFNFRAHGNLDYLQRHLTSSLSGLVDKKSTSDGRLKQTLIAIRVYTHEHEHKEIETDQKLQQGAQSSIQLFRQETGILLQRLETILLNSIEINRNEKDTVVKEHLHFQISNAFSHMPETRLAQLEKLRELHHQKERWAEEAQVYLLKAQIYQDSSELSFGLPRQPKSRRHAIQECYQNATKSLEKARLHEQCHQIYKRLLPMYEEDRDWQRLSDSFRKLHEEIEAKIQADKTESRMLGTYYRVGFYGRMFGRLDGQEYIYKMPKITQLSEINQSLTNLYSEQYDTKVRTFPDSGKVDASQLNPNECWLQITFVQPCWPEEENEDRKTFIEKTTNLKSFKFSTPFTRGGKNQGDCTSQYKRNTILEVEHPFPYVLTAQPVLNRRETILEPIESSIEDVQKRVDRINAILAKPNPDPKMLTGVLAGAVATQVHGGVKELCHAFLPMVEPEETRRKPKPPKPSEMSPRAKAHSDAGLAQLSSTTASSSSSAAIVTGPADETKETKVAVSEQHQEALKTAIRDFLNACSRALEVNRNKCCTEQEKIFQATLDESFRDMCVQIDPMLIPKTKQKKRNKKRTKWGMVRFAVTEA